MTHSLPTTLISIVGLTPQVVTETLYHLVVERKQNVTDVIVITTPEGRENLLGNNGLPPLSDQIAALAEHYQFTPPHFDPEESVFVGNEPIDDPKFWRTAHSHPTLPDLLIQIFKEQSKDDNRRLHLSLAGGRKTMSSLATLLFSLWARPQDELSHVLVTSEFIQWRKFFPQSPAEAEHIAVVSLPMPKLRILLDVQKLNNFSSYQKLVQYLEQEFTFDIAPPHTILDYHRQVITPVGYDIEVRLKPLQTAIYTLIFESRTPVRLGLETINQIRPRLFELYQTLASERRFQRFLETIEQAKIPNQELLERIKKQICEINLLLRRQLPSESLYRLLKISATGNYGNTHHYIKLPFTQRTLLIHTK